MPEQKQPRCEVLITAITITARGIDSNVQAKIKELLSEAAALRGIDGVHVHRDVTRL